MFIACSSCRNLTWPIFEAVARMPRSEYIADLFQVLITCSGNFCSWFGATPSLGRKCLWGVNPVAWGLQQWESRHGQSFLEGRLVMVSLCLCLFAEPHTWQEGDAIGNTCLALSPFLTAMCPRLPSADDAQRALSLHPHSLSLD